MGKQSHDQWGDPFSQQPEENEWMEDLSLSFEDSSGTMFIEEAHEALNKLHQKTNKRGRLMRLPKRAESWR